MTKSGAPSQSERENRMAHFVRKKYVDFLLIDRELLQLVKANNLIRLFGFLKNCKVVLPVEQTFV